MSYCRFAEGDVYVIRTGDVNGAEVLECVACQLVETTCFDVRTEQQMIDHLREHERAGDRVPERAYARLEAERDGKPFETEIQAALRELREDAGQSE